jgi:hypothetical protein
VVISLIPLEFIANVWNTIGQWLRNKKIPSSSIHKTTLNSFIKNHLFRCNCPVPRTKEIKSIKASFNQLLKVIHEDKLILIYSDI